MATAQKTAARTSAEDALLDAAERLLAEVGYAGITTRRLAEEAGLNHGLVHYYFGSIENLLVHALERFTTRLITRQGELYAADLPFADKWRTAMRYLVSEDVSYEKIWLELQALAWNNPDIKARLAQVNAQWRAVLAEAFEEPHRELGIPLPLEALVSLVMTFNLGMIIERLGGIETGHRELLDWIDQWISRLRNPPTSSPERGTQTAAATPSVTAFGCITRFTAPASRPFSCCRPGRSSIRGTGRCRSPTWPGTAGSSPSTGAATAGPIARRLGTGRTSSLPMPSR